MTPEEAASEHRRLSIARLLIKELMQREWEFGVRIPSPDYYNGYAKLSAVVRAIDRMMFDCLLAQPTIKERIRQTWDLCGFLGPGYWSEPPA